MGMNRFYCRFGPARGRQQGLSTVLVSIVLLLAATIVVFFTARSALVEQRISGNELRSKQALAAAEAGLGSAEAYVQEAGVDHDDDGMVDSIPIQPLDDELPLDEQSQYRVVLCDPVNPEFNPDNDGMCGQSVSDLTCTPPSALAYHAAVFACGWSDDQSARHMVTRLLRSAPSLPFGLDTPLTSKGGVNFSGNVTVANYFENLTIFSGEALDLEAATTKTFVRRPDVEAPPSPDLSDPSSWDTYTPPEGDDPENFNFSNCTSDNFKCDDMAIGTRPSSPVLSGMDDDEFFEYFFGLSPEQYKHDVVTKEIGPQQLSEINDGEVVWIDGEGGTVDLDGDLGSREKPVILIVDVSEGGVASFGSNAVINGVVYVRGDTESSGTPRVNGAMAAEGTVNKSGGNLEILFDPLASGLASQSGESTAVPGTWRDWPE